MASCKGSDKVVFTGTDRPFGRVCAMIPQGDILNRNIFIHEQVNRSSKRSDFSLSIITCVMGRWRAEKKEHTDKNESLYAYLVLLSWGV
jgi:hypothetical protein